MLAATINVSSPIDRTPRVMQVEGMFDIQAESLSSQSWTVALPLDDRPWNIGLIVGPSGCGKSTIARRFWPEQIAASQAWPKDQSILDAFPENLSVKDVTHLLSSVGFSSPPYWLRPFHVLSTGQQFRVSLARLLTENATIAVVDEFTSVVDRTVAQIGSAALAKTVRARNQRFIAVTCHEDVEPWLNPDWVYRPDVNQFTWRLLQRRPAVTLKIQRVHLSAWKLFKHHHYLNTSIHKAAVAFVAFWQEQPVAFSAWVNFPSPMGVTMREHRTVTLPDFQGVGIGHALSTHIASMWKALGVRPTSTTTHPAFIAARARDPNWRVSRAPSMARRHPNAAKQARWKYSVARFTAGFEYIGPAMKSTQARALRNAAKPRRSSSMSDRQAIR